MDALPDLQRRKRIDPHVHQVVEQPGGVRPALQRLPGQLEEQRTEGTGGVHDVIPAESGLLEGIEFLVVHEEVEGAALLLFDDPDDFGNEAVPGPEEVDHHAVAGAELGGQLTQAQVADPAVRGDPDGVLDEPVPWGSIVRFTRRRG